MRLHIKNVRGLTHCRHSVTEGRAELAVMVDKVIRVVKIVARRLLVILM